MCTLYFFLKKKKLLLRLSFRKQTFSFPWRCTAKELMYHLTYNCPRYSIYQKYSWKVRYSILLFKIYKELSNNIYVCVYFHHCLSVWSIFYKYNQEMFRELPCWLNVYGNVFLYNDLQMHTPNPKWRIWR